MKTIKIDEFPMPFVAYIQELIHTDINRMRGLREHATSRGERGYKNTTEDMARDVLGLLHSEMVRQDAAEAAAVTDSALVVETNDLRAFLLRVADYTNGTDTGSDFEDAAKDLVTKWGIQAPAVPETVPCPDCDGVGSTDLKTCALCGGNGEVSKEIAELPRAHPAE